MTENADLESVLETMSSRLEVTHNSYAEHPHYAQYKNYGSNEKRQRERREEWLLLQREGRAALFDKRRLTSSSNQMDQSQDGNSAEQNGENNTASIEMEDDKLKQETDGMSTSPVNSKPGSWRKHVRNERRSRADLKSRFMYGEWLIDVSEDFADKWTMVAAPRAKRCLVVFHKKSCQLFDKNGIQIHRFNTSVNVNPAAILDGLVHARTVHILDFIDIKPYDLQSCDFDCRRFIGQAFLNDNNILDDRNQSEKWKFALLETAPDLHKNTIEKFMSTERSYEVDGLIFYHREGFYTPGVTPLVAWLKPWMVNGPIRSLVMALDGTCPEVDIETKP